MSIFMSNSIVKLMPLFLAIVVSIWRNKVEAFAAVDCGGKWLPNFGGLVFKACTCTDDIPKVLLNCDNVQSSESNINPIRL